MASNTDTGKLKEICERIVREGDLDTLTDREVRRHAEKELGLEEKSLDEKPFKKMVKEIVADTLEHMMKEKEEENAASMEFSESGDKKEEHSEDDSKGDADSVSSSVKEDDGSDMDSDNIAISTPSAKRKNAKRSANTQSPVSSKRVKSSGTSSAKLSKGNEATIANLKSYINKCGLRKIWAKELAGMSGAEQIRHLKQILDDLGMEGRPTLEKCKKIKDKRDLQAELDAMDQDNIIDKFGNKSLQDDIPRKRRSVAQKKVAYNVDQISDSEEGEAAAVTADEAENDDTGGGDEGDANSEESVSESDAYTEDENDNDDEAEGGGNTESSTEESDGTDAEPDSE
ncbi:hypothetical protein BX070DRAFT_10170 [Coemansia spiralis]|nr:hypothetical protein BX070DRAFT_10170 [Coemansia spiralis]